MRKHFLLLFLMALLPLVGWAQGVNLSDGWTIELSTPTATYDGTDKTPIVTLKKNEQTIAADKFIAVWKKGDEVVNELIDANPVQGYTVTVTANGTDTYAELAQPTKKFYILKATPTFATSGTTPKGALKFGGYYSSSGYSLIETEPTVTFGQSTILYKVTDSNTAPASDADGWVTKADIEKAVNPGIYYVWFKIPATDNYVEFISAVGGVDGDGKATSNLTITGIDITTNDFTAPVAITTTTFDYDDAEHAVFTTPGSWGTKPVLGTFKYTIDGGTTWKEEIPKVKDVASYTVNYMIKGKDGHNDYTPTTSFTVVVKPTNAAQISFAATQGKANLTYNAGDQALLSSAATADLGATPTYKVKYNATDLADDWSSVTDETSYDRYDLVVGKNAGFYRIEALVATAGNYKNIESKFITVEIQKAKLYVTTKAATKVYGAPDPAFEIEYRGFQGNDWYEAATGKTVAAGFSAPTLTRDQANAKAGQNVGGYKITASGGAADNYEFDFTEATGKSVFNNLTIEKKVLNKTDFTFTLDIDTNDPLTYNGTAQTPDIAVPTYDKYDGTHSVDAANLATDNTNLVPPTDYAFTYQNNINAGVGKAQVIITGQNNFDGSVMLTFDINKADIYVLPLAAEKNYGTADPTDVATPFTGEANPSVYQYKLAKLDNSSYVEVPNAVLNGTVRLQREAGEAVSTYKIYFKSYTPDANVADNYDVKNTDVLATETAARRIALFNLKQASEGLKLKFKSDVAHTKVYGDGTPKWTIDDLEPVAENPGFVGGDTWETVKPTLSAPVFTLADENVSYANNQVTVSNLASTNYPTVTVEPLAFTIYKRPIAITVVAQTQNYGATPDQDAAGTAGKWSVVDANSYKNVTNAYGEAIPAASQVGDALVGTDAASVLGIKLYLENDPYSYTPGTTHEKVIMARIKAENSNYELNDKCTWGDLTINPVTSFILSFTDENLATKIATEAAAGTEKPIMFGPKTLNAKEWYAMVLPFNTTPAELVQKLGEYVVVNKLSSSKLGSKGEAVINFSMEWDEIKAGEPFVIKASKEINLQGKTFDARKIFAGFEEKSTDKATFKGNYETGKMVWLNHNLDGTEAADKHYRWLSHTGAAKYKVDADGNIVPNGTYTGEGSNNWKTAESAPHYLAPMEAYLELTSDVAYARIFVEDFENGVTAIKSLSADEVNGLKIAEGWYTIDGIRLQSAPTQKGIYINNGKKVVVK